MFLPKGSFVILLVVIATCIHVNSVEGLREKRQADNSGASSTPPPSSSSSKPNRGLLTILGDTLKIIPIAGSIVAPVLYYVGGLLGGIFGFLS